MASITVRNLEEGLKRRLRIRAAEHGGSMEEEARSILRTALGQIAAIARCRGAQLATRNIRDFEGTGVSLINPWSNRQTQ